MNDKEKNDEKRRRGGGGEKEEVAWEAGSQWHQLSGIVSCVGAVSLVAVCLVSRSFRSVPVEMDTCSVMVHPRGYLHGRTRTRRRRAEAESMGCNIPTAEEKHACTHDRARREAVVREQGDLGDSSGLQRASTITMLGMATTHLPLPLWPVLVVAASQVNGQVPRPRRNGPSIRSATTGRREGGMGRLSLWSGRREREDAPSGFSRWGRSTT